MTDYLFEHQVYDAFELFGGQSVRENNIQIAFYEEQLMKGRTIPVLGLSDSHGNRAAGMLPAVLYDCFVGG